MKEKKTIQRFIGTVCILALLAAGSFLAFTSRIFQMIGLLCLALGITWLIFRLLRRLGVKHPKLGKALRILFIICLCLGVSAILITEGFILSASKGTTEIDSKYVLVLGAGVDGETPSLSLQERLIAAKNHLDKNPDAVCIVSGGQGSGENISEALCMFRWLTAHGIDESRVWMEDKATTTEENIRFSLALIAEKTGEKPETLAIVSSEYHLFRASLMAKAQNVQPQTIPAKTSKFYLRFNYYLREVGGVWYFLLFQ